MFSEKDGGWCSPCNTIWKQVEKLPSLDEASRNHAYILPDNSIWVLNHDGTEFVTADRTNLDITSPDNSITITKNGVSYQLKVNENLLNDLVEKIDLSTKQDKLAAGENVTINNNVISAIVPEQKNYKAGDGVVISNDEISVINNLVATENKKNDTFTTEGVWAGVTRFHWRSFYFVEQTKEDGTTYTEEIPDANVHRNIPIIVFDGSFYYTTFIATDFSNTFITVSSDGKTITLNSITTIVGHEKPIIGEFKTPLTTFNEYTGYSVEVDGVNVPKGSLKRYQFNFNLNSGVDTNNVFFKRLITKDMEEL